MPLIGHGSKLLIGTATNATNGPFGGSGGAAELAAALILSCLSVDLGSNKVDTHDVTDMLTSSNQRVFIGGLENPGDLTVKYNIKPGDTAQALLETARAAAVPYDFQVQYPGSVRIITFSGIVSSIDEAIPDDKPATASAKIQISGVKVYTPTGE